MIQIQQKYHILQCVNENLGCEIYEIRKRLVSKSLQPPATETLSTGNVLWSFELHNIEKKDDRIKSWTVDDINLMPVASTVMDVNRSQNHTLVCFQVWCPFSAFSGMESSWILYDGQCLTILQTWTYEQLNLNGCSEGNSGSRLACTSGVFKVIAEQRRMITCPTESPSVSEIDQTETGAASRWFS